MSPLRRVALGLWIVVFAAGGFLAADRLRSPPRAPVAPAPPSVATPVATPTVLPDITLRDLQGKPRSLREWSGRTLLINFWATWCSPCRHEMPLLQQLQEASDKNQLQVIGIAIDRLEPVLRFVGETGVNYPILAGEMDATRAAEQFGEAFVGLPFSVLAAPDGTILALHTGEFTPAELATIGDIAAKIATGSLRIDEARARLQRRPGSSPAETERG